MRFAGLLRGHCADRGHDPCRRPPPPTLPPPPKVLVAWRSRRATAIRLLAPFIFLLLALIVNLALEANNAAEARIKEAPAPALVPIDPIPSCHDDLFIGQNRECIDFLYTPDTDAEVAVRHGLGRQHGRACKTQGRQQRRLWSSCHGLNLGLGRHGAGRAGRCCDRQTTRAHSGKTRPPPPMCAHPHLLLLRRC
jgi:hypothetical protein